MAVRPVKDWALHFAGGALMATLEAAVGGSAALAVLWPMLLGYARETEQQRAKARAQLRHPGAISFWSGHRISEWLAWGIGAAFVVGAWAAL